jgi:hypothetical protein
MLSTKNISPGQLSFLTAVILSVPVGFLVGQLKKIGAGFGVIHSYSWRQLLSYFIYVGTFYLS